MKRIALILIVAALAAAGCEPDRQLVPNTHDGRVPDVINFTGHVDSVASRRYVKLSWAYDTVRYSTDRERANLRDWEVFRSIADTSYFQSRGRTFNPVYTDSSDQIQLSGRDSVIVFYKVYPAGYTIDNIQFIGKPSDILQFVIK